MSIPNATMRTPMSQVRGLGPARSGTGHFWMQRVTAVANVVLAFAFVAIVIALFGRNYSAARALLAQPLVALLLALFVVSGCIHMRLGMQVILEDYVHGEAAKVLAVMANLFFAIAVAAASLFAIFKLAVGG